MYDPKRERQQEFDRKVLNEMRHPSMALEIFSKFVAYLLVGLVSILLIVSMIWLIVRVVRGIA